MKEIPYMVDSIYNPLRVFTKRLITWPWRTFSSLGGYG